MRATASMPVIGSSDRRTSCYSSWVSVLLIRRRGGASGPLAEIARLPAAHDALGRADGLAAGLEHLDRLAEDDFLTTALGGLAD